MNDLGSRKSQVLKDSAAWTALCFLKPKRILLLAFLLLVAVEHQAILNELHIRAAGLRLRFLKKHIKKKEVNVDKCERYDIFMKQRV